MHLIILSLWDGHFFSDITVGIRHFLKSLIRLTSRSVHEIFLGWAEQARDATKTIPADDDLGKAVLVTERHDWHWDRLRVQDGPISSSVWHRRGKQSGAVWERVAPSRRTNDHRTWAFFLSSQSAMQAMLPGLHTRSFNIQFTGLDVQYSHDNTYNIHHNTYIAQHTPHTQTPHKHALLFLLRLCS